MLFEKEIQQFIDYALGKDNLPKIRDDFKKIFLKNCDWSRISINKRQKIQNINRICHYALKKQERAGVCVAIIVSVLGFLSGKFNILGISQLIAICSLIYSFIFIFEVWVRQVIIKKIA